MLKKGINLLLLVFIVLTLSSCKDNEYEDYIDGFESFEPTIGTKTNGETIADLKLIYGDEKVDNLKVLPVDFDEDFIFGVDMSSIIDVENAGGVFYNADGEEQDVFEILKDHGVNYVRIRLWHDPYSATGLPFGGGTNDTATGIQIAKRAARVGMRIALDFHYSDFWADPGKQTMPRAWEGLTDDEVIQEIYDYTYETIKAFEEEGVRPHMVQVGNEINNGMAYPVGRIATKGYPKLAALVQSGISAVNDISTDIITVIHLAEGASEQRMVYFFDKMLQNDVEFDVIGLSYYSFWHGPLDKFQETLEALDEKYEQDIAVMEYSYGWTDYSNEFSSSIYSSGLEADGGYKTSMQGQVSYIRDVNAAVASIESGIGTFYWEPAWLAIDGAGWAGTGATAYLEAQGDAVGLGKASWANQAFFSFSGKVLPTLNVFEEMRVSTFDNEAILDYEEELNVVLNIRANETLPPYTVAYTSLDRRTNIPITWNQTDLDKIDSAGTYIVNGTINSAGQTLNIICNVEAYENYFVNSSFEDGGKVTADVGDFSKINGWDVTQSVDGAARVESKNARTDDNQGSNNLNIWSSVAYSVTVYQTITLEPGTYEYTFWARSADTLPPVSMIVRDGTTDIATQVVLFGASWSDWTKNTLTFTITETKSFILGFEGDCPAGAWAHFEDFSLRKSE